MSKRITRFLTLLAVFALATASIYIDQSSGALTPQGTSVAGNTTRNAAILATTSEVLKETSHIRELPILRPVRSGAQSRAQIERMLIRKLDEQMTNAEMHATELTLRKFGLAPSGFEFRSFIIKLLTEQVAGYYDTRARQFHLADWLELEVQKPVMAHELTHALQDQHFNLRRFEKWPAGDSDAELAAHALIEGDATLAMTMYMTNNPLVALAFARSIRSSGISSEQFNQAPRALRETLVFPYVQGVEWATRIYRQGGWGMVSKAYTRLPLSSEQILHPEKYLAYERPVKILLPDLTNLLNSGSKQQSAVSKQQSRSRRKLPTTRRLPPAAAWRRVDYDVNGEWSYFLILDQFLKSPAESRHAAAGWAGDRYAIYEGPERGQVLLAQVASWDTENDAREFFDAYVKRTELRYPGAKRMDSSDSERQTGNSKRETRNSYSWQTSEGSVVIELRGLSVLMLEGTPEGIDRNAVVKALWQ